MKMPHEIIVDEKIKLIKIEKDFNQEELIENLEDINDKSIQDFLGMDKNIIKEIEDTNVTMLKLAKHLEKIGFKYEGKLRDNYGIDINSNVWSLLKREYNNF